MIKVLLLLYIFFSVNPLEASNVIVKTKDNFLIEGEFVGTYMKHIHLLVVDSIEYFHCNEIESIVLLSTEKPLVYNCNENSVSEEILFPPEINPMTGNWMTIVPDVFNRELLKEQKEENNLEMLRSDTLRQKDVLEMNEKIFKKKTKLKNKGSGDLIPRANKIVDNIHNANDKFFAFLDPHDLKNDIKKPKNPVYLTKSEIQILIKEELQKHLRQENYVAKELKKKNKEPSLYERYKNGSITEDELNKIVNGRPPIELLEANLITQEEYSRNPKEATNPFTYIEKYGLETTITRKPEFIILPACGLYVFFMILFQ